MSHAGKESLTNEDGASFLLNFIALLTSNNINNISI